MSTAEIKNAPIASVSGTPGKPVTKIAAPAVDQAAKIGVLYFIESVIATKPIPIHSDPNHELA